MSILDEYDDDYEEPIFCQMCLKIGYQNRLVPGKLMPGETKPIEADEWLRCETCGWLCPIYEVEKEATIKDSVQTIDNPFDQGKFYVESIESRASQTKKRRKKATISSGVSKPRSKRFKQKEEIDPDIANEKGEVNIIYDSSR
jgi:hypothetical protein